MSTVTYADFIARRKATAALAGRVVEPGDLHWSLKPFQVDLVTWAARVGRPAVWADTGLGKTRMQLEWCRVMADTSLIVTPLAVAEQTISEAARIHIDATYVRSPEQITGPGVYVTNYEMVEKFDPASYWKTGCGYLAELENELAQPDLFDGLSGVTICWTPDTRTARATWYGHQSTHHQGSKPRMC